MQAAVQRLRAAGRPVPDDRSAYIFLIVQQAAEELGMIRRTTIGAATVRLFEAAPMVELYARLLAEDAHRMFGIPPR